MKVFRITIPEPSTIEIPQPPEHGVTEPPQPAKAPVEWPSYAVALLMGDDANRGEPNASMAQRARAKLSALAKSARSLVLDADEYDRLKAAKTATKFVIPLVAMEYARLGYPLAIDAAEECEIDGEGKLEPVKRK